MKQRRFAGEAEAVWAEVRQVRRRGGITASEQQALAAFGIDLDEVLRRMARRESGSRVAQRRERALQRQR